jgi:hypothetical protein
VDRIHHLVSATLKHRDEHSDADAACSQFVIVEAIARIT